VEEMNITIVAIHAQNATLVAKKRNIFQWNNLKKNIVRENVQKIKNYI